LDLVSSNSVLELVSQSSISSSVGSPVDIHTVSGSVESNSRAAKNRGSLSLESESLSGNGSSSSLSISKDVSSSYAHRASTKLG
jgi:hypothetical protein